MFDFLKRKKKEEGFDAQAENAFPDAGEADFNNSNVPETDLGFRPRQQEPLQPFSPGPSFTQTSGLSSSEVQLVLAKLDILSQRMELMDRRLQVIEDIAKNSK